MKLQTAHDAEADETRFLFFRKDLQGHADFFAARQEGAGIRGFSKGSGSNAAPRADLVMLRNVLEFGQSFQCGVSGLWVESAGLKHSVAETHRFTVLLDNAVMAATVEH